MRSSPPSTITEHEARMRARGRWWTQRLTPESTARRVRNSMRGPLSVHLNTYRGNHILRGVVSPNSRPLLQARIKWEENKVNNLPTNDITFNTFKNGNRAIKIDKIHYLSQNTVERLSGNSAASMFSETNKRKVLFQNPFTRQGVKRGDLKFVKLLKRKNR